MKTPRTDCFVHHFPGCTIELAAREAIDTSELPEGARRIVEVLAELAPVVQPLAADLSVSCRNREFPTVDDTIEPPQPLWHLRQTDVPAHLAIEPMFVGSKVSEVPQLTAEALTSWLIAAHDQPSPRPSETFVSWESLYFNATRARILEPRITKRSERSLRVMVERKVLEIPLESYEGGTWLAGPIPELATQPPLVLAFSNSGFTLNFELTVHWSLWTQRRSRDRKALSGALARVLDRGWQPVAAGEGFDLPRGTR